MAGGWRVLSKGWSGILDGYGASVGGREGKEGRVEGSNVGWNGRRREAL